jgi:hypothetical protein
MTTVLYHAKVGGSAKLILLGIANHEGDGGAYPAVDTLARYANIDRRQTQRILRGLEDKGLLVSTMRFGSSTLYRVAVQCPENCDRSTNHRLLDRGGVEDTPSVMGGGVEDTPRGGVDVTPGAVYAPPEPSITVNITNKDEPELFQTFWDEYPKKIDRAAALKAFTKLTAQEQAKATKNAYEYANSEEAKNIKYVLFAVNYLQNKRFNDKWTPSQEFLNQQQKEKDRARSEAAHQKYLAEKKQYEIDKANGLFGIPSCKYDENTNILRCKHPECNE